MRFLLLFLLPSLCLAQDPRYCGPPERDARGEIKRSTAVRAAFVRLWPCPSTGEITGSCPGWSVDHQIPLASGGCDSVINMGWLPNVLKSGPGKLPKDRWERKVYGRPQVLVPMP